jgi:peptide/nickel transport system substrate-binding protein
VPLGIIICLHRPLGTMILDLAYTGDAQGKPVPWNESYWVDPELDTLLKEADKTLDIEKRRAIMCKLEDIQMARGSIGLAFFANTWYIVSDRTKGVQGHPQGADLSETAYIDEG